MTNAVVDAEVNYFCAYNFPAVALTLGPERWEGREHHTHCHVYRMLMYQI